MSRPTLAVFAGFAFAAIVLTAVLMVLSEAPLAFVPVILFQGSMLGYWLDQWLWKIRRESL